MKKMLIAVAGSIALLAAGCTSLPEGARKMTLNINSVEFQNKNNVEGFLVDYTVHHSSAEPMPIDKVKINIKLNGREAANYVDETDTKIVNREDKQFLTFVPANRTYAVAKKSLISNPMLQLQVNATVEIIVDEDSKSAESAFNVKKNYKGIIHGTAN
ncbi:MAG: hypothetical protein SPK70_02635 [Succinivibrio dextrinosolvens]|nr:hypothetical protein [Succinivibrio dextrinosolvens]MDY6421274.1 hypothetical protein [Succinivibrio dextrinosolvens]MDY6466090.1 hypothetical protein [Succinivibrio dextrinosolvens]MDY6469946.1 hypothetical protein [Succinivibrio dextrinosolvens]